MPASAAECQQCVLKAPINVMNLLHCVLKTATCINKPDNVRAHLVLDKINPEVAPGLISKYLCIFSGILKENSGHKFGFDVHL